MAILYSFRRCPFAMRARFALLYYRHQVELREVRLRDKPPSLLAFSPKGTVPVLIDGDTIIEESLEIMNWALEKSGETKRFIEFALIKENDTSFKKSLDRYKYPERFPERSQKDYREEGLEFLTQLNISLSKTSFLTGENFGFNDMAILPFVRQFANVDRSWFDTISLTEIKKLLISFEASELFAHAMVKYPVWQPGEDILFFPQEENLIERESQILEFLQHLRKQGFEISPSLVHSFKSAPPKSLNILMIRILRDLGLSSESHETITSLNEQAHEIFDIPRGEDQ